MVGQYRDTWKGRRTSATQAPDWPRFNVQLPDVGYGSVAAYVQSNVVPVEVDVCCWLALQANIGDLAPNLDCTIKQDTIGPITTVCAEGAPEAPRYRAVDQMLASYICGSGPSGRLVRG